MPPKPKYTKEQVVDAAFELVRTRGIQTLTARELGKTLGVSSSPVFTIFKDMEELKGTVFRRAKQRFDDYMEVANSYFPAYKKRGMQWIRFASDEPQLFRWIFMANSANGGIDEAVKAVQFGKQNDIDIITRDYNATPEQAERLFCHMWIYTYGLCVMTATGTCRFSDAEQAKPLGEQFGAIIGMLLAEKPIVPNIMPEKSDKHLIEKLKKNSPDLGKSRERKELREV